MMTDSPLPQRRLAAILSADVVDYSRHMQDDEAATIAAHRQTRQLIADSVARHGGRVVHTAGDSVLAEFDSAIHCVQCAIEIQKALADYIAGLPAANRLRWRIGINVGDVVADSGTIHGDGINVAARVQALAEPGGILVTGIAYNQVRRTPGLHCEFNGRHRFKNIAEPVPVYRVTSEPPGPSALRVLRFALHRRAVRPALAIAVVALAGGVYFNGGFPLPGSGRPASSAVSEPAGQMSIAVLPFANLNRDPTQDYFSDGITNELIVSLSKLPSLFVIASHSSFVYKDRPARAQDVGRELGVRYVVEGGVQKAGPRLRITAQLVDTHTGFQLWAERYDRELRDLFALQDDVTGKIVSALSGTLTERERRLLAARYTTSVEAYDYFLRGRALYIQSTREANHEARAMLKHAIDLDPGFARAHASLALTHTEDFRYRWSVNPAQSAQRALESARYAVRLDKTSSQTWQVLSYAQLFVAHRTGDAIEAAERAIVLDPNNADAYSTLGVSMLYHGQPEEAATVVRRAMRLNPLYPSQYAAVLGQSYYFANQHHDAVTVLEDAVSRNSSRLASRMFLVAALSRLGRLDDARWAAAELLALDPGFVVDDVAKAFPVRDPEQLALLTHDLRQAGLK
jgi:adenylate cyclase